MPMNFSNQALANLAFAKVTGTDATVIANRGFSSITRASAGVYNLVREAGLSGNLVPAVEIVPILTLQGSAAKMGTVATGLSTDSTDTTAICVRTFNDSGTASDCDFTVVCARSSNHEGD